MDMKEQGMNVTSTATATPAIVYPESDGKPMGETDVHIDALIYLREALKDYFREAPQVYVAGNMLFYYEEGNPAACVAPDVFVVQGIPKHERRIYKLWEEGQPPAVVFEITSRSTRLEDQGTKRALYAMLGVKEYFLYDPLGEYLQPPLQGYRLQEGEYERMLATDPDRFVSQVLGLELRLIDGLLYLVRPATGERLLSPAEAQAARRAAEARAAQEAAARQAAEARATLAEAELQRLRAELERPQGET
jgi:Uma2 family endonuclease